MQLVQQPKCSCCRGAAVAESRTALEQLASVMAVLLSREERLDLQFLGTAAASATRK